MTIIHRGKLLYLKPTKSPHISFMGELWDICCEYFQENYVMQDLIVPEFQVSYLTKQEQSETA